MHHSSREFCCKKYFLSNVIIVEQIVIGQRRSSSEGSYFFKWNRICGKNISLPRALFKGWSQRSHVQTIVGRHLHCSSLCIQLCFVSERQLPKRKEEKTIITTQLNRHAALSFAPRKELSINSLMELGLHMTCRVMT